MADDDLRAEVERLRDLATLYGKILGEAQVERDAAVREAWDEGWEAAYGMAHSWGHVDWWESPWPENPYRNNG